MCRKPARHWLGLVMALTEPFFKRGTEAHRSGTSHVQLLGNEERGLSTRFAATQDTSQLIKGVQSEVLYQHQPGATAQRGECGPHSAIRRSAGNSTWVIEAQTESPSFLNHRKGKTELNPAPTPLPTCRTQDSAKPIGHA